MTTDFDLNLDSAPLLQSIHQLDFVQMKGERLSSAHVGNSPQFALAAKPPSRLKSGRARGRPMGALSVSLKARREKGGVKPRESPGVRVCAGEGSVML